MACHHQESNGPLYHYLPHQCDCGHDDDVRDGGHDDHGYDRGCDHDHVRGDGHARDHDYVHVHEHDLDDALNGYVHDGVIKIIILHLLH